MFEPYAAEVLADPVAAYDHLLDRAPVCWVESFEPPFCILSRYEDVESALRDIATFSSEFGQGPRFTPPAGMLSDPPQHTFFRGLVQQAFTPRAIAAMGDRLEARAALLALAVRYPALELAGDGERIAPFFLWGRRKLPVTNRGVTHAAGAR
jgi:cytochrome P450